MNTRHSLLLFLNNLIKVTYEVFVRNRRYPLSISYRYSLKIKRDKKVKGTQVKNVSYSYIQLKVTKLRYK